MTTIKYQWRIWDETYMTGENVITSFLCEFILSGVGDVSGGWQKV